MERIRPPYRPEDDQPFGGERWGCFWLVTIFIGLIVVYVAIRILLNVDSSWIYLLNILLGVVEAYLVVNYLSGRYRR